METPVQKSSIKELAGSELPGSIVDAQLQRLLEVVNNYQQQACATLMQQAQEQSSHIVRQAYQQARMRFKQDIQESRQQMEASLFAAKAKQHTFMMQQKHQVDREFLDKAWELLKIQLGSRWSNLHSRVLWIQKLANVAQDILSADQWLVEYPEGLPENEKQEIQRVVADTFSRSCQFCENADLSAGIRIKADDAIIDGSISGLLADKVGIESSFLSICRECIVHSHD